ncbi:hypothetical protein K1719_015964 [Acacia pycnantha]|nr:hypothetical protein K1719_015964 [Acacia pycnantha]
MITQQQEKDSHSPKAFERGKQLTQRQEKSATNMSNMEHIIEILSRHAYDEVYLGTRDNPNWTYDVKPLEAFKKLRKKLEEIEKTLIERNNTETVKNRIGQVNMHYTLLYPTSEEGLTCRGIPNSISI